MANSSFRLTGVLLIAAFLTGCTSSQVVSESSTSGPVIVQPGAPGQSAQVIASADDIGSRSLGYTEADVAFMQGMIHHHAQAIEMVALIEDRSEARDLRMLGLRIDVSQESEIKLMQNWLRERGEEVPDLESMMGHADMDQSGMDHADMDHANMDHSDGGMDMMPGMLSAEQMQQLRDSSGAEFYQLWLVFMIQHHEGALTMVDELMSSPGAAQDQDIFHFASEVDIDQRIEILRMREMLANQNTNR